MFPLLSSFVASKHTRLFLKAPLKFSPWICSFVCFTFRNPGINLYIPQPWYVFSSTCGVSLWRHNQQCKSFREWPHEGKENSNKVISRLKLMSCTHVTSLCRNEFWSMFLFSFWQHLFKLHPLLIAVAVLSFFHSGHPLNTCGFYLHLLPQNGKYTVAVMGWKVWFNNLTTSLGRTRCWWETSDPGILFRGGNFERHTNSCIQALFL